MDEIVGKERDALLLQILKRLEHATPHADAAAWERGWRDSLERFRSDPSDASLVPEFIRAGQPTRRNGAFWSGDSELLYVRDVQKWIAEELHECDPIYEFGCGTGFNLVALARLMPHKAYVGCDRSRHAIQLTMEAAERLQLPILAGGFDMLRPHGMVPAGAGVFTSGAMEQLGQFQPFIDWLLEQRPARVVHVEPIPELLDEENLVDWLSLQFHAKRGYTRGLLPYLQGHPGIEVLHVERSNYGSLMLESYARIIWRPR